MKKVLGCFPSLVMFMCLVAPVSGYSSYICDPLAPKGTPAACPGPLDHLIQDFSNLVANKAEASVKIQRAGKDFSRPVPTPLKKRQRELNLGNCCLRRIFGA